VLLPVFLIAARRFVDADPRGRRRIGVALVGLEVVWAQIHGSFVLAPALFAVVTADRLLDPKDRGIVLAVLGGLTAGLSTSAFGFHLGAYLLGHTRGDATLHIVDWLPLRWEDFAPRDWLDGPQGGPYGAVLAAMAAASILGMVVARRVFWKEVALAALGAILMASGCRFLAIGGLLAAPLAAAGLAEIAARIPRARHRWLAGAAFGAAMVGLQARGMHLARGPLGRIGLAEGDFPLTAAEYLRRAVPAGAAPLSVLSSYDAGGPLGFWLPGKVRTYVDARTPLYFDDTDFGVARDVFRDAGALAAAIQRYDAGAVVMPRRAGACPGLAARWSAVAVEARFTTFVPPDRAGAAALGAVAPCGPAYLREDACRDGGRVLDDDLDHLAAIRPSRFVDFLRAERILRCGGPLASVPAILPSPADARAFRADRDRTWAGYLLRAGRPREAVEVLAEAVAAGDPGALALAVPALSSDQIPVERARDLLEAAVGHLDDAAPPDLRALLAVTCAEQRDLDCARFQALRAAAGGSKLAVPTLTFLAREHPSARARADADAWLSVLRAPAKTAPAPP
jgi:hypothetical protein